MDTIKDVIGKDREFYIEHDAIPLHVKLEFPENVSGTCPLVIVQHGFTGHMEEEHILAVSRTLNKCGFATMRVELYGHGKSGGSFCDHTLFKWLSGFLTVIDYARSLDFVTDLFLCGHSQGGLLVMMAGAMKQDVIRGIIPLSPASMIPEESREGRLLGVTFDPYHVPEFLYTNDGEALSGNYARVAQTIFVEPAIDAFHKDVLIIHGDQDESVPVEVGIRAAKRYQNAKLVIIPGDDHCYNYHLDQVMGALAEYMKQFID